MYKLLCLRALFFVFSLSIAASFLYKSKKDFIFIKRAFDEVVEEGVSRTATALEIPPCQFKSLQNSGAFSLKQRMLKIEPPDLRDYICLVVPQIRPDVHEGTLYLKLKETGEIAPVVQNSKIFLKYNISDSYVKQTLSNAFVEGLEGNRFGKESLSSISYCFSLNNEPTSLWLEVESISSDRKNLQLKTCLQTTENLILHSEKFILNASPKASGEWFVGNFKMDASLLTKQKAVWHGKDLFLKLYGGNEFAFLSEKEKISFIDDQEIPYNCYLSLGEYVVWYEGRWTDPKQVEMTQSLPLLSIKKIDSKFIILELSSPFGLHSLNLNLIKYPILNDECSVFYKELSYVGLKNWGEAVLQTNNGERIILSEGDWLYRFSEKWKILDSLEDIDNYISGVISAPLFVFQKIQKKGGSYLLKGTLFNSSRTHFEDVELSLYQDSSNLSSIDIIPVKKKDAD